MNYLGPIFCVALTLLVVGQCFVISIKMTATAKPYLRVMVGAMSFFSIAVAAVTLGHGGVSYPAGIALLLVPAIVFWRVLHNWKNGMPEQHESRPAELSADQ